MEFWSPGRDGGCFEFGFVLVEPKDCPTVQQYNECGPRLQIVSTQEFQETILKQEVDRAGPVQEDANPSTWAKEACQEAERALHMLGGEIDAAAATRALDLLCAQFEVEPRVERMLELMGSKVSHAFPKPGLERRTAMLALMAARGAMRRHQQLPFDRAALLAYLD